MKTLITVFFILLPFTVFAQQSSWENNFILRGGFSFNMVEMETPKLINNHESKPDDPEDETRTLGFGGFTSIAYRVSNWEFGIASDFVFGRIKDVTFISGADSIRGGGSFRLVSFGPQIKFYTPWTILNKANIYIGGGPAWSLQTFVFSHSDSTGNFNNKKRISFENYGGGLCVGIEEIVPSKSMHPIFIEVGYSYMHSYRVSILDASDTAEVITLSESQSNDFSARYLIVRAGMALF